MRTELRRSGTALAAARDVGARRAGRGRRGLGKKTSETRHTILLEAAKIYSAYGYEAATMRDIAASVGLLPGSLYHHFSSKDRLIGELHRVAIEHIIAAIRAAIEGESDPWKRLESACAAHLDTITSGPFAGVLSKDMPMTSPGLVKTLVGYRDRYETLFRRLVEDLAFEDRTRSHILRLELLGALNWAVRWYRPGGKLPAGDIARQFVANLRRR